MKARNIAKLLVLGLLYLLAVSWNETVTAQNDLLVDPLGRYSMGVRVLAAPAQGSQVTEIWFRINATQELAQGGQICSTAIQNDCVKWIEFFTHDAQGNRVLVSRKRWDTFTQVTTTAPDPCSTGCLEAVANPPAVAGRYKRDIFVHATVIAVEADGTTEVEAAPPLGSAFGKRPRPGVAIGTR